ncbi:hypothetical protein Mgra_00006706 [Meloidogyne graminicola]|uniref:Uncharacterized protein n=1 Tax=Meloidogyne graminicola TaxID=189291 RepID=A0A8S9ZKG4_9BILA|nr:hypothetical protein Mgra_00006706 [Meloidogyne graminicola]
MEIMVNRENKVYKDRMDYLEYLVDVIIVLHQEQHLDIKLIIYLFIY